MIRSLVRPAAWLCAASALTLTLLAVPASTPSQAASISIANCNSPSLADNGGGNFTLTCATSGGGSIACSISASPSAPTVSQAVVLTASCSGQTGSVSYTWSGGGSGGCPSAVQEGANPNKADLAAPGGSTAINGCNYALVASDNGTNTSSSPTKTISYTVSGSGGTPPPGGPISCPGFSNTQVVDVPWPPGSTTQTKVISSGFGPADALIFRFTTSSVTTAFGKGNISAVEVSGGPSMRTGALSATPCDFSVGTTGGGTSTFNGTVAPSVTFTLFNKKSGYVLLQPNTTYYFNIMNTPNLSTCASTGNCDMDAVLTKPTGS